MSGYPHQTVGHGASISAAPEDDATVRIEVAVGDTLTLGLYLSTDTAVRLADDLIDAAKSHGWTAPDEVTR